MDNQPIQSTPPPPSPSNSSKTFLLILGAIALMAVSALGGYYLGANKQSQSSQPVPATTYSPSPATASTPDEAANWKTYISDTGKFSIKYPSNWPFVKGTLNKSDEANEQDRIYFGTNDPNPEYNWNLIIVEILVYKNSSIFKSPNQYFQDISGSVDSTTMKYISVGGVSGIRANVKGIHPFSADTVVFEKDGYFYRFELLNTAATNRDKNGNLAIFDQILSTFQFSP